MPRTTTPKDPLSNKFPIDFVSLWADGGRASRA